MNTNIDNSHIGLNMIISANSNQKSKREEINNNFNMPKSKIKINWIILSIKLRENTLNLLWVENYEYKKFFRIYFILHTI